MSEDRGARRPRGRKPRRKVCAFCVDKIEYIDYKEFRDVNSRMRRNINERGKIMPRRMSGNCLRPSSAPVPSRCCPTPLSKKQSEIKRSSQEGRFFVALLSFQKEKGGTMIAVIVSQVRKG